MHITSQSYKDLIKVEQDHERKLQSAYEPLKRWAILGFGSIAAGDVSDALRAPEAVQYSAYAIGMIGLIGVGMKCTEATYHALRYGITVNKTTDFEMRQFLGIVNSPDGLDISEASEIIVDSETAYEDDEWDEDWEA